jgi:hypothetical protein
MRKWFVALFFIQLARAALPQVKLLFVKYKALAIGVFFLSIFGLLFVMLSDLILLPSP